jgi:glucose-1-phosphate thymidylyltransferase
MVAIVGVIPAAGHATRLGPRPGSKEAIEIGGRPLLDYLVERLRAAPCAEVRLITRPEKGDVLELGRARGLTAIVAYPETIARSLFLGLAGLDDEDVVCFGFPDCLWEPVDGFESLVVAVQDGAEIALGLFRTREPESYDPVLLAEAGALSGPVDRVEVKPRRPSSNLTWGCAAGRVRALRGLERERDPGEYFASRCREGVVFGRWLSDTWIDLGTPERLAAAEAVGGVPSRGIFTP